MPELPEVETMRRGVAPILGLAVAGAEAVCGPTRPIAISPSPAAIGRRIVGRTITRLGRAGKRVVIWFSSGDALVLEPRMTGLVLLADPPTREHLRYRLRLAAENGDGAARELLFWDRRGLGSVRLLSERRFATTFGPEKLGPDALDITAAELQTRLGASRRAIKVALLDQRAVAGIGNLYAAEILHAARVWPLAPCDSLTPARWKAIAAATREVLREAIEYEGSTLGDGTYRNALNQQGRYQNHHRVYDRAGLRCGRCHRSVIRRIVQAQRSTFYCPSCQRARK